MPCWVLAVTVVGSDEPDKEEPMTVTEGERYAVHQRLDEMLGTEEANVLMELLPPVGWADVATKRDLENFANQLRIERLQGEASLRAELNSLGEKLGGETASLRTEMAKEFRQLQARMVGTTVSVAAIAVTVLTALGR